MAAKTHYREVIPPPFQLANDNYYDSDSSSNYGSVPPLIERDKKEDTESENSSHDTVSTADSTTCSWEMLENVMDEVVVTTNEETLLVSAPPKFTYSRTPMGLNTSPYEALVVGTTDQSDLAPTTMITVTKINESHQGRFKYKALFDSGSTNNIISRRCLPRDFEPYKLDKPAVMGTANGPT